MLGVETSRRPGMTVAPTLAALLLLCLMTGSAMAQQAKVTLTPGQTFYEGPDDIHVVDRNASRTRPANFLAFIIKDKGAPVLVPAQ